MNACTRPACWGRSAFDPGCGSILNHEVKSASRSGALLFGIDAACGRPTRFLRFAGEVRSPLNREVFHMPSGVDLTVDYGVNNHACKLEVPADLLPLSMRGKELNQ